MEKHKVVSKEEWLVARKEHLIKEKEFTRLRDELSRQRRELPWEAVKKEYVFEGPTGKQTLPELFEGRSELVVYHFMYPPSWSEGCKSCSFWADNYNGIIVHLNHRDVTMVTISKAPFEKLEAFRKRMGWQFKWFSSFGNDFNRDYQVSFTPEEMQKGEMYYNYRTSKFPVEEAPGISVFYKDKDGNVFHTYSCYARGLDMLNGAYHYLDLVPKGRDEDGLPYPMEWLRHHDKYGD
jgi:predicted dithiol-disulfide oxidoreductase (DUF899 family)